MLARLAAAAAVAAMLAGCGQLDAAEVAMQRSMLRSTASEAATLADGAARASFTNPFVAVRASELGDDATEIEDALADDRVAPEARGEAAAARADARRVADAMRRLQEHPGDRELARQVAADMEAIAP